jgi:predicted dehydrogenase
MEPPVIRIKDLISGGALGEIRRFQWTITRYFRPNSYFTSSLWRGRWIGEGGGLLLNQCFHQLDLIQWFFGLPQRLFSVCRFGGSHPIEVEDEVVTYLNFPSGMSGTFIASTAEFPGSNRLEIIGDRGRLIWEGSDTLVLDRLDSSLREIISNPETPVFHKPGVSRETITLVGKQNTHAIAIENFVSAIVGSCEDSSYEAGVSALQLANAILMSAFTDDWVQLPVDPEKYWDELKKREGTG